MEQGLKEGAPPDAPAGMDDSSVPETGGTSRTVISSSKRRHGKGPIRKKRSEDGGGGTHDPASVKQTVGNAENSNKAAGTDNPKGGLPGRGSAGSGMHIDQQRPKPPTSESGGRGHSSSSGSSSGVSSDLSGPAGNQANDKASAESSDSGRRNATPSAPESSITLPPQELSRAEMRGLLKTVEKSLNSSDPEEQLIATKKIRQLLSVEREYLIDDVIAYDLIPRLLGFLKRDDESELQVEALWALTNVAAGSSEHTRVLIQKGAIPALVGLMKSKSVEVLEQAVWVLGNVAGDGPRARDEVLSDGAMAPLLKIVNGTTRLSLLRISTWALSNMCDGQPQAYVNKSKFDLYAILKSLVQVMNANDDTEVLSHVCWALSHLCDGPSPYVEQVVNSQVCEKLISLLEHRSWRVSKPALRTIGNIVCAEDDRQDYTEHIVKLNAVDRLKSLVNNSNREIQKEACWTLSNIAAGTVGQIERVVQSGVVPSLIGLTTSPQTDAEVKIEACWVLLNATSCGSCEQIEFLAKAGCVSVLCDLLTDSAMAMMALEGLEKILLVGDELQMKAHAAKLQRAGALGNKKKPGTSNNNKELAVSATVNPHVQLIDTEQMLKLQQSNNPGLSKRAAKLWKRYYVACAICDKMYARNTPETSFCQECKCTVCKSCDCTRFHLSYQLSQWDDIYSQEASEKTNKAKAKKKKKKKKKQKAKEKKEANTDTATSVPENPKTKNGANKTDAKPKENSSEEDAAAEEKKVSVPRKALAVENLNKGYSTDESKVVIVAKGNDEYVDYLSQGGSIFELAKMLDLEQQSEEDEELIQ